MEFAKKNFINNNCDNFLHIQRCESEANLFWDAILENIIFTQKTSTLYRNRGS